MIVLFEPLCEGREHSPFNAGIVQAASRISPDGRVIFFGEPEHMEAVKECIQPMPAAGIEWRPVQIPPRHSASFQERFTQVRGIFERVWTTAEQTSAMAVIGTAITEPGLAAVKLKLATAWSSRPVGIVFHAGLSRFLGTGRGRLLLGRGNTSNLRFMVLGEHIRRYTSSRVPAAKDHMCALPHPITGWTAPMKALSPDCIRFGFLGLGSIAKGFPEFIRLAQEFREQAGLAKAVFEMVGRPAAECTKLFEEARQSGRLITAGASDSQWPWTLYRERVESLCYALMPFDAVEYLCTCSGSALDAIAAAKPMIALDTAGFRELFDDLGDIGYLCRDYQEMRCVIGSIAANPPLERYARQCENLIRGREVFTIDAVAARLKSVLGLSNPGLVPCKEQRKPDSVAEQKVPILRC